MDETDASFAGSIPELYDTYLVPLIFEAYASDLARRVAETEPAHVLEIAAGTGVVTRALAPLLGKRAHYVVSDLNQPMLTGRPAGRVRTGASPGDRRTRSIFRSKTPASTRFSVSSARCSFPIGSQAIGKRVASSNAAVGFFSMFGTG